VETNNDIEASCRQSTVGIRSKREIEHR